MFGDGPMEFYYGIYQIDKIMKKLILMLAILVSGIASAQDGAQISITELASTFGPAARVAIINYTEDVCPDSERSLNNNTYRIAVPQVNFTWVGEAGSVGENARVFTELDHPNSAYNGVQYTFQFGSGGFSTPARLACNTPPLFAELFDHGAITSLGALVLVNRNTLNIGNDIVIRYRPETNDYEETWNGQVSTFRTQRSYIDVISG